MSKWRLYLKELTNQTSKERVAHLIIVFCLLAWLTSLSQIRINELDVTAFGPFQYLPFFYWFALLTMVCLNLILSKPFLKFSSMLIICLMTLGTLSIIMPYGGASPDAYAISSLSRLIFEYGNLDFGYIYIPSYPTSFVYNGIVQEVLDVSVRDLVRFYPLFIGIFYMFGIAILVSSISDYFNIEKQEKLSIIALSFLAFGVFMFSVGARIDPVPQAFAIVLLPYFLGTFIRNGPKWRVTSLLLLAAIVSSHMMTSFILLLITFMLLLFVGKQQITRFITPLTFWFAWMIFIGISQFKFGFNFLREIQQFEISFLEISQKTTGLTGAVIPGTEMYLLFRKLTVILIGLLLLFSLIYLFMKRRKLSFLLVGLLISTFPLFIFWLTVNKEFLTRIVEMSVIFVCLIFGFGMHEFLKDHRRDDEKNLHLGKYELKTKMLFTIVIMFLILTASFFSILTARHSDMVIGYSASQIKGNEFIVYKSNKTIFAYRPLAVEYPDYITVVSRETHGLERGLDDVKGFEGIIGISQQWVNWQQTRNLDALVLAKQWLNKAHNVSSVYDNGNFRAYTKKKTVLQDNAPSHA